jgi:hypothetical protein
VLVSFVYVVVCRLFALMLLLTRSDHSMELEILVLRQELAILRRQARRPQLTHADRLVLAVFSRVLLVAHGTRSSLRRRRCCAGTGSWSPTAGRTRTGGRAGHLSTTRYGS